MGTPRSSDKKYHKRPMTCLLCGVGPVEVRGGYLIVIGSLPQDPSLKRNYGKKVKVVRHANTGLCRWILRHMKAKEEEPTNED